MEEVQTDEFGIEMKVKARKPAPLTAYSKENIHVPPILAKWLRPHQREGVQFMYECVMGMKDYGGAGCILADDMGLVRVVQTSKHYDHVLACNRAHSQSRFCLFC